MRALPFLTLAWTLLAFPAAAQATRTWVSGVGDDANPCSRTAPCKTFAGAISKTVAGGEINAIDVGGFGSLTITKAITIDGHNVLMGVLVSGANAITVAAGAGDVVVLRGLDLQGLNGTGLVGVRFTSGKALWGRQGPSAAGAARRTRRWRWSDCWCSPCGGAVGKLRGVEKDACTRAVCEVARTWRHVRQESSSTKPKVTSWHRAPMSPLASLSATLTPEPLLAERGEACSRESRNACVARLPRPGAARVHFRPHSPEAVRFHD